MNIAVLYAYPNDNGYNHAILNSVMQGLEDNPARHSVTVVDLYKENFDPVLRFDENHLRRNLNIDPDTERYRRIITDADLLVFIYPIWWSGMPAILKSFIDRVFSKGFAYVYRGVLPKGLLKGKKAWIITTNDTPGFYARLFEPDYGKVLHHQILKIMCGVTTIKHHQMSYLRRSTPHKRTRFLTKVQNYASKL